MFPEDQFRLTRQAALALMISSTFPAAAYAAAAARVDFTVGPVSVTGPDGRERPVAKGAEINTGDTINTGSGRAQLRFTDGAYVSLQPQSQFKVDDYRYEGKIDGSEKGFFSLLKGGLRTLTGAIGRVNRGGYQVQTPTATIGIRGTEYLAALGNSLTVSVGGGIIALTNNAGEFLVSSGQTAFVADQNTLPVLTFEKPVLPPASCFFPQRCWPVLTFEKPVLPLWREAIAGEDQQPVLTFEKPVLLLTYAGYSNGTGPVLTSEKPVLLLAAAQEGALPPEKEVFVSSEQTDVSGNVAGAQQMFTQLTGFGIFGGEGAVAESALLEHLSFTGAGTATCNALGQCTRFSATSGGSFLDSGTTTVVDFGLDGIIGWGRWTNGTYTVFDGSTATATVGPNQGMHYVVGVPTAVMPTSGSATYSVLGATQATSVNGSLGLGTFSGALAGGNVMAVNFATSTFDMGFNVAFSSGTYTATVSTNYFSGSLFSISLMTTTTGTGSLCTSGCSTSVEGFFAGANAERAGIVYDISDGLLGVHGAAALTKN